MPEAMQNDLLLRYQRLIQTAQDLASILDLDILLQRIVNAAAEISQAEEASILLYDHNKRELHFQAATNLDSLSLRGIKVPVENSIAGWIVTHNKAIIISDAQNDERHYGHVNQISELTTKTLLGVPLVTKNQVIGALEAINKTNGQFTKDDQDLLITLGTQAAVAIENARLFQQSDLIAEFVHELRTPLTSLNTAAHLLLSPKVEDDQKRQMVEAIQTETTRLSELATTFLDLSMLESGRTPFQIQAIHLGNLLKECWELMKAQAQENGIEFQLQVVSDLPTVSGDHDKLKQAILNLISNAIKYNRPGGRITLKADQTKQWVLITIQDTGIGIPAEYLPRLFTKFYRVPGSDEYAQGTGLGLSIVRKIVENHGGKISVESTVGQGTTFAIRLPI
jgi:signal transduction histidine kinase